MKTNCVQHSMLTNILFKAIGKLVSNPTYLIYNIYCILYILLYCWKITKESNYVHVFKYCIKVLF